MATFSDQATSILSRARIRTREGPYSFPSCSEQAGNANRFDGSANELDPHEVKTTDSWGLVPSLFALVIGVTAVPFPPGNVDPTSGRKVP